MRGKKGIGTIPCRPGDAFYPPPAQTPVGACKNRLGPLTLVASEFTAQVASYFSPTFEFAVWNIGNIWLGNALLIGLAVFGFMTATRGQALLKDEVFDSANGSGS